MPPVDFFILFNGAGNNFSSIILFNHILKFMQIDFKFKPKRVRFVFILCLALIPFSMFGLDIEEDIPIHTAGKRLVKGTWSIGGTFSGKSKDFSYLDFLIADVNKYYQEAYTVRFEGDYFFRENLSAGMGLYYGAEDYSLSVNFFDNLMTRYLKSVGNKYGSLVFLKNYIPVSANYIFFITNQTEIYYDYESANSETYVGSVLERKNSVKNSFGLGIRPGILIFFTEGFAFNINMGILGFSHSVQENKYQYPPNNPPPKDLEKEDSKNRSTDINLKFDLLKVGFGFSYYF